MRRARPSLRLLAIAAGLAGFGGCEAPALRGRAIDRASGAPIEGAIVVEEWREAGWMGEPARTAAFRIATSQTDGRFAFEAARVASGDRAPVYHLAHRAYGLVHAGELAPSDGAIEITARERDATAMSALAALCESPPREAWEREIATQLCSTR
jgi:hypothetical protein